MTKFDEEKRDLLSFRLVEVEIGKGLLPFFKPDSESVFKGYIDGLRKIVIQSLGFVLPGAFMSVNPDLAPNSYRLILNESVCYRGDVFLARRISWKSQTGPKDINHGVKKVESPGDKFPEIPMKHVIDPIFKKLEEYVTRYADELLTRQGAMDLLDNFKREQPACVEGVLDSDTAARLSLVHRVLRNLLSEGISIRNLGVILEVTADFAEHLSGPDEIAEQVREALRVQVTSKYKKQDKIHVMVLDADLENSLINRITTGGKIEDHFKATLEIRFFNNLVEAIERIIGPGLPPVLICSPLLRKKLRDFIVRVEPRLHVMSFREIETYTEVEAVEFIDLKIDSASRQRDGQKIHHLNFKACSRARKRIEY